MKTRIVTLMDLIEWHGTKSLFWERDLPMFNISFSSVYDELLRRIWLSIPEGAQDLFMHPDNLKDLGRFVLSLPMPWIGVRAASGVLRYAELLFDYRVNYSKNIRLNEFQDRNSDLWFGTIIIIAPIFEILEAPLEYLVRNVQSHPIHDFIGGILFARVKQIPSDQVQDELNRCGLSYQQQSFIWRWIRQEINFVRQKRPSKELLAARDKDQHNET